MRIYLVGFMMSGKTTLGELAAYQLHVPFLDTDREIEMDTGLSIRELFERYGEEHFRQLETVFLHKTKAYSKGLMATGGGLPCHGDNMDWMMQHGITVYLHLDWSVLSKRLQTPDMTRPLIAKHHHEADALHSLYEMRTRIYQRAAITLELSGLEEYDLALVKKTCRYIW